MHALFARSLFATLVSGWLAAVSLPAQAGVITDVFIGHDTLNESSNPFGLAVGDPIPFSITYDDSLVSRVGPSSIVLDSSNSPPFALSVTVGNRTFVESEAFNFGFPEIFFVDGSLSGINFLVEFSQGTFADLTFSADGFDFKIVDNDTGNLLVAGTLVPEPATLPLLATGLGVLAIARLRRRKAA